MEVLGRILDTATPEGIWFYLPNKYEGDDGVIGRVLSSKAAAL